MPLGSTRGRPQKTGPGSRNYKANRTEVGQALIRKVHARLEEAIAERAISKQELAKTMDTSISAISQLFHPDRNLSIQTLAHLADGIGVEVSIEFYDKRSA
jgi:ribosome-binding protein aMBF1 (putative translation factor)